MLPDTTSDSERSELLNKSADVEAGENCNSYANEGDPSGGRTSPVQVKTYWWRWTVLAVFCLDLGLNNAMWITFSSVAEPLMCYYGSSSTWINSLSMSYMFVYVLCVAPASWMLLRRGLRFSCLLAMFLNTAGAWLRYAGSGPEFFWLLLLGQVVTAFPNVILWSAPSLLSSVWFPTSERATATAFAGAICLQVGVTLSLFLGPFIIHSDPSVCGEDPPASSYHSEWSQSVNQHLSYYLMGQAILSTAALIATLFAFPDAPPTPPSVSRLFEDREEKRGEEGGSGEVSKGGEAFNDGSHGKKTSFAMHYLSIFKNFYFIMFLTVSAINIGVAGTYLTIYDELVVFYHKDLDKTNIAFIGLTCQLSGILAMLVTGRWLDWTKSFYFTTVLLFCLGSLSVAGLSVILYFGAKLTLIYVGIGFVGASFCAFQAVGYEYAVEMTYPLPEGISAGLLNALSQVVGMILTVVFGVLRDHKLVSINNWMLTGVMFFGAVVTVFIRPRLRRIDLDKKGVMVKAKQGRPRTPKTRKRHIQIVTGAP